MQAPPPHCASGRERLQEIGRLVGDLTVPPNKTVMSILPHGRGRIAPSPAGRRAYRRTTRGRAALAESEGGAAAHTSAATAAELRLRVDHPLHRLAGHQRHRPGRGLHHGALFNGAAAAVAPFVVAAVYDSSPPAGRVQRAHPASLNPVLDRIPQAPQQTLDGQQSTVEHDVFRWSQEQGGAK